MRTDFIDGPFGSSLRIMDVGKPQNPNAKQLSVIPAQAGIQYFHKPSWIPDLRFAASGMTNMLGRHQAPNLAFVHNCKMQGSRPTICSFLSFLLVVLLLALVPATAFSSARVALVVGNGEYKSVAPLIGTVNDARDMGEALETLGFEVITRLDADKGQMLDALDRFAQKLPKAKVGLFYFAGHGLQINGQNYLLPIKVRVRRAVDVEHEGLSAQRVLATMEDAGTPVNIMILDACRNNPFNRFRGISGGLGMMRGGRGSFIAYATSPGSVAIESDDKNGIYTSALLKHIHTPSISIEETFKRVRADVIDASAGVQVPWESSSLVGTVCFAAIERDQRITNHLGMEFVWLAPGRFTMGSPSDEKGRDDDETQHPVALTEGFYLQTTEVTVGQWRRFVQATGYTSEAETDDGALGTNSIEEFKSKKAGRYWDNPGYPQTDDHPVTCVSWNDAQAFIQWLNRQGESTYSLPTEAQWEYACRGGTTTARFWGENPDRGCQYANVRDRKNWTNFPSGSRNIHECDDGYVYLTSVGSFRPNPFGLYDMLGNVNEWCADWYAGYPSGLGTDPEGPTNGSLRIFRGGGCNMFSTPGNVRCSRRLWQFPDSKMNDLGFRLSTQ